MGSTGVLLLAVAGLAAWQDPGSGDGGDRLYGRVTTDDGLVVEGYLRWDRNEGSWTDLLNGSREIPEEVRLEARRLGAESARERERSVEFMGVRVSWEEPPDWPDAAESGVRFGHLRVLRVLDDDAALLQLKSGEEVELFGGSTDLGRSLRGLQVEDAPGSVLELSWGELAAVEFLAPPSGRAPPSAARLHGTLEDRWGHTYTGYVAWDVDEILVSDVLDGEEDGRRREIPFGSIAAIERFGSSGARVILRDETEMVLRDSDDVDDDNAGIQLSDPGLGQVQVGWDEFESVRFHPPARPTLYADFDGGHRLRGTVVTEDGLEHTGLVRWDSDEAWSWEILDGSYRGVVYDVEFGNVARIVKRSSRGAEVTLRDGRVYELEDSNDVDRDNKGIFVTADDGSTVAIDWSSFREVVFEWR